MRAPQLKLLPCCESWEEAAAREGYIVGMAGGRGREEGTVLLFLTQDDELSLWLLSSISPAQGHTSQPLRKPQQYLVGRAILMRLSVTSTSWRWRGSVGVCHSARAVHRGSRKRWEAYRRRLHSVV